MSFVGTSSSTIQYTAGATVSYSTSDSNSDEAVQLVQNWNISLQPTPIIINSTDITQDFYQYQESCKKDLINDSHNMKYKRRQILALSHILDLDHIRSASQPQEIPNIRQIKTSHNAIYYDIDVTFPGKLKNDIQQALHTFVITEDIMKAW